LDRLDVFYSDTAMSSGKPPKVQFDPLAVIEGNVGEWFKVTVRDVIDDTINVNQKNKYVLVSTDDDGLVFSATANGASAKEFPLTNGVAVFWVSGTKDVSGACVDVVALDGSGGPAFNGISPGNRCDITFFKPSSSILRAVVYGDGHGRPDSVLVYYADGGAKLTDAGVKPDKVTLTWPTLVDGVTLTVSGAALTVRDELTLHVNLAGAATRPSGYTSISGQGRGLVTVYGGSGGADAGESSFEVLDGIGPILAKDGETPGGSNPVLIENLKPGSADTLRITLSEQIRDVAKLKGATLFYTKEASPTNEPGASGGSSLTVLDAFLYDGMTYTVVVEPVAGGLEEGNWIRFNPAGGVADRAAQAGIISDNAPHAANRWVQLTMQEVAPSVVDAWYTANSATGKVDVAYVVFDKPINVETWFAGGKVKFDKDETTLSAAVLPTILSASKDTLKIELAVAFKSSQSAIRTSSPMTFTLSFAGSKGWGASSVIARDKAAPVLANSVILKIGSLKDDGAANPDTFVVVYSESPHEESLKLTNPITIYSPSGNEKCKPELKLMGAVVPVGGTLFYRATYVVDGDLEKQCPGNTFPEVGDSVNINASAGLQDNVTPPNVQSGFNLKQVLKIERGPLQWTVTIKNNPFRNDGGSSKIANVKLDPAAKGAADVKIKAQIMIFDNVGALVLFDTLMTHKTVDWPWNGTNMKGRKVGTGTYLFKAVCEAEILNDAGVVEDKQRFAVSRSLGVVRGKN